jgi:hypothetical protein
MDEIQQYNRREYLDIVGIPRFPDEDPKQLMK